jgi:translation initiation factor 6 (eIF-6)
MTVKEAELKMKMHSLVQLMSVKAMIKALGSLTRANSNGLIISTKMNWLTL